MSDAKMTPFRVAAACPPAIRPTREDTVPSCAACGAPLGPKDAFCGDCGAQRPATRFCGDCGAPVEADAKFCGDCGASLGLSPGVAAGASAAPRSRSSFGQILGRSAAVVVLLGLVVVGALAYRGGALPPPGVGTSSSSVSVTPGATSRSSTPVSTPGAAAAGGPVTSVPLTASPNLVRTRSPTLVPTLSPNLGPTSSSTLVPALATAIAMRAPTTPGAVVVITLPGDTASPTPRPSPTTAPVSIASTTTATTPPPLPTMIAAASVLVSDSFRRPNADRCALGPADLALGGRGRHFYLPLFPSAGGGASNPIGASIVAYTLQNNGQDYGGVQLTSSSATCTGIRGENLGQDLNIQLELLVPSDAAGHVTQAGPFIRSRAAAPGDGIIGGASAGYWIQLHSTGEVTVKRLNPPASIASSGPDDGFDDSVFHQLEIAVQGTSLQIELDGELVSLVQDGNDVTTVTVPATGGTNDGAAGIAFGAETSRGQIGGQRAKNLVITSYHSLAGP